MGAQRYDKSALDGSTLHIKQMLPSLWIEFAKYHFIYIKIALCISISQLIHDCLFKSYKYKVNLCNSIRFASSNNNGRFLPADCTIKMYVNIWTASVQVSFKCGIIWK